ncbi:hypothetical protein [Taibaiella koreensis]|uniref:hypothetical protein n=1 Tax=Taibaiella koreensis TaxID=1268548 RepID=UPI000E59D085|nr:hypothetical protein [Taibaiella koreensis]
MKKYSIVIAAALFLAACGNANKTEESATATGSSSTTTTETTTTPSASAPIAKVADPVCGMERGEEQWTEFVANGADTAWFCSPHCKETFEKNPEKYKHKSEEKKG